MVENVRKYAVTVPTATRNAEQASHTAVVRESNLLPAEGERLISSIVGIERRLIGRIVT